MVGAEGRCTTQQLIREGISTASRSLASREAGASRHHEGSINRPPETPRAGFRGLKPPSSIAPPNAEMHEPVVLPMTKIPACLSMCITGKAIRACQRVQVLTSFLCQIFLFINTLHACSVLMIGLVFFYTKQDR